MLLRKFGKYFQSHGVTTRKTLIYESITDETLEKLNRPTQVMCA